MDLYKPIEKYVCENANHELSIADGIDFFCYDLQEGDVHGEEAT